MYLTISRVSTIENVFQLLGLFVIFIIILVATYFTARWVGAYQLGQNKHRNITVIETFKISQTKYLQIVKITNKYVVIGVSKDHVELITELSEEEVLLAEDHMNVPGNFKDILRGIVNKEKGNKNN
ncbi:flagellar biosynthetic protein FliO [Anaeromicropila herbilytica]|uniref:Flagellar protein FliO/FliZ n=1 Tax=Anaeromicropila herbilytica TaxID=2785025 RepID=A0A7R7IE15_9FIRM|nr:flagellar biosynthetic protein FliO [Anaeromicropila herbilytica]BCN31521.1 hypothetical protein bsdtb5_28160 [Anaeromicropila herbilytica]